MSTTTVRVLIGTVITAGLLGIGALEVVGERVPRSVVRGALDGKPDSPSAYVENLDLREELGGDREGIGR